MPLFQSLCHKIVRFRWRVSLTVMFHWIIVHLTIVSRFRSLHSVERDQKIIINGIQTRSSREEVTIPTFHGRTEKIMKASVRICGNSDEIQTEGLPNKSDISFFIH